MVAITVAFVKLAYNCFCEATVGEILLIRRSVLIFFKKITVTVECRNRKDINAEHVERKDQTFLELKSNSFSTFQK